MVLRKQCQLYCDYRCKDYGSSAAGCLGAGAGHGGQVARAATGAAWGGEPQRCEARDIQVGGHIFLVYTTVV